MSEYQIRLMNALANQGLSWPVTYEAASARRSRIARVTGRAGSGFRFRAREEESRSDRDLFLGVVLLGHGYSGEAPGPRFRRPEAGPGRFDDFFGSRAGEKCRELVKLPLFPGVGLVVVALGTLDLHPMKIRETSPAISTG